MTPILRNHDVTQIIGFMEVRGAAQIIVFDGDAKITKELLFAMFPGIGCKITGTFEDGTIRMVEVLEFSITPEMR